MNWLAAVALLSQMVVMPDAFLGYFQNGESGEAYWHTSRAFRSYVSADAFPAYLNSSREFQGTATFSHGRLRMGEDCRQKLRLLLDVGACFNGRQLSRLVFVWEDGQWRFDHVSTP
jgi:hypothetical protein